MFKRTLVAATTVAVVLMTAGTAAFAADPTPPSDPGAIGGSVLANLGNGIFSGITAIVGNVWYVALFVGMLVVGLAVGLIHRSKAAAHKVAKA